jgi:hypothetical protein
MPANRLDPWVNRKNENGVGREVDATVAYRHSRQKHAGMTNVISGTNFVDPY